MAAKAHWRLFVVAVIGLIAGAALGAPQPASALPMTQTRSMTAPATTATPSAVSLPTTQVDGVVWAQIIVGGTVYVGGKFAHAQPAAAKAGVGLVARPNILAYTLSTGVLVRGFAPKLNGQVLGLVASSDGKTVYAVGSFTTANGRAAQHVVALNATTGAVVTGFSGRTNGTIDAIARHGGTLYVGGSFTTAGGKARLRIAALAASTGAVTGWVSPIPDGEVRAIVVAPDGTKLVAGGSFGHAGGRAAEGLVALDTKTGLPTTWRIASLVQDHGVNSAITSLWSDGTDVYGTGYVFGATATGDLEGAFSASWTDGTATWIEDCHGDSYSIATMGSTVYVASHEHYCGNLAGGGFPQTSPAHYQRATAFTKAATGTLSADQFGYHSFTGSPSPSQLNWYPDLATGTATGQHQAAWSVTAGGGYVLLGGEFPTVNGVRQAGLARFALRSTAAATDGPRLSGAAFTPTVSPIGSTSVRVSWLADWDRDDADLVTTLTRNSTVVDTVESVSHGWWSRPQLDFADTGLAPGVPVTYQLTATDPDGHSVRGGTVTVTPGAARTAYDSAVLGDGAAHFWRLDGLSGYDGVIDAAGTVPMASQPAVRWDAAGPMGATAAGFGGYADGSASAATQTATAGPQTFTVEAWFRTTSTAGGGVVDFGDARTQTSAASDRTVYLDAAGAVHFGVWPGTSVVLSSRAGLDDGTWHLVDASVSAAGVSLSVDGTQVDSRTDVTSAQDSNGYWRIGGDTSWSGEAFLNGSIADVAVYPTALTVGQIANHWHAAGR